MSSVKLAEDFPKGKIIPGCDKADKEIFDFPYLTQKDTINFIENHGNIIFILRGLPNTRKTGLCDLLTDCYPSALLCSADHYFDQSFSSSVKSKERIAESHKYCEKKVESACKKGVSPIIIKNTHVRKWEMQHYINCAAMYGYTIIMAITVYKFDVTPESLQRVCDHGLSLHYYRNRVSQWEDVIPEILGWFCCSDDSKFIYKSLNNIFSALLNDGKFCRCFDSYTESDVQSYFEVKKNLVCIAAYFPGKCEMKQFYLSEAVQSIYGKCFCILIRGYFVTTSSIIAFVEFEEPVNNLIHHQFTDVYDTLLASLSLSDTWYEFNKTVPFNTSEVVSEKTASYVDFTNESLDLKNCSFIHLAQSINCSVNITETGEKFVSLINFLRNENIQLKKTENDLSVFRINDEVWFVKLPQNIKVKTIFTGMYL